MADLSPAAQAVLNASNLLPGKDSYLILAAALRAAADQLINVEWSPEMWELRDEFHAIAAELENADG
jgi:hypothetical protein